MGIKGAWKEFRNCNLENDVDIGGLEDLSLAIDVNLWLEASVRGSSNVSYNTVAKPYLATLIRRLCSLLACGVHPVVVFDGPDVPDEKNRPLTQLPMSQIVGRHVSYRKAQLAASGRSPLGRGKHKRELCDSVIYQESTELLDLLGVPYVIAKGEGEAQCAWLEQNGIVDGTVTSDCDYFLFGGEKLFKLGFKRTYPETKAISFPDISEKLKISRNQFITAALLSGCDYEYNGVKKIGFKKAQLIIQQFRDLDSAEAPLQLLSKFRSHCLISKNSGTKKRLSRWQKLNVIFPADFPSEKKIDLYLRPNVQKKFRSDYFVRRLPQKEKLIVFTKEKLHWSADKVESYLRRIEKQRLKRIKMKEKQRLEELEQIDSKSQSLITDFMKSVKSSPRSQSALRRTPKKRATAANPETLLTPRKKEETSENLREFLLNSIVFYSF